MLVVVKWNLILIVAKIDHIILGQTINNRKQQTKFVFLRIIYSEQEVLINWIAQ